MREEKWEEEEEMQHRAVFLTRIRDGKEPEPSVNEPNQNPGFVKNQTEHEPKSTKCARTQTEPYP